MNQWTTLNPLPDESLGLSPAAAKLRQRINDRIAALLKARAQFDAEGDELRAIDSSAFKGAQLAAAQARPLKRLELLRAEMEVRQAIAGEWAPVRHGERQAARHRAQTTLDEVEADVRARLISIGYVDGLIPGAEQQCIIPDMIRRHPDVFAHRQALATREAEANTTEDLRANTDDLERVGKELEAHIRRAVAGAV